MKLIKYFFLFSLILSNLSANSLHDLIKNGTEDEVVDILSTNFYFSMASTLASKTRNDKDWYALNDDYQKKIVFLNERDQDGNTPLHLACAKGYMEVVKILVGVQGVNQIIKNNAGQLPKDLLISKQSKPIPTTKRKPSNSLPRFSPGSYKALEPVTKKQNHGYDELSDDIDI